MGGFTKGMFKDDENVTEKNDEPNLFNLEKDLDQEIKNFSEYLSNVNFKTIKSTRSFWIANKGKFPKLLKLAIYLLNISASSAFVERFFSIAGIICKKNSGNMNEDLIIKRSMLKANIEILDELNE